MTGKRICFLFICFSEELEIIQEGAGRRACSRQALPVGTTWGPYEGKVETTSTGSDTVSWSRRRGEQRVSQGLEEIVDEQQESSYL